MDAAGAIDAAGAKLYLADPSNGKVRVVDTATGAVSTLAGGKCLGVACGAAGYADGTGLDALFNTNAGMAIDGRGHLFVVCRDCETTNARSEPRCLKCNRRLHRSINERLDPLGAKNVSMKWVYVMAAVLLLSLAGFILVQFSGFRIFE